MQKRLATTLLLLVAAALCLGGQQARRGLASPLAGLAAEWAPDEAVLLLVNGTLARFHLKTEAEELLATDVAAFALSADGTRLALARGGRLEFSSYPELRTLGTVQPPARADGKGVALRSVAWSPDGQTLAAGTDDGRVLLWELASGELWGEIGVEEPRAVTQVSFSADGARLFSLFADGRGILWTLAERDVLSRFPPPEAGDGEDAPAPPPAGLAEVRLSPAGEHLLVT
ncbi:MAG: WD40 repeat domain-containing protein, partial [Terriglobia bacterium]